MTETEKPDKLPPRKRIARCLVCSNEWGARNGNEPKPSRCPECKTRSVKWRDECTEEELKKVKLEELPETPEEEPVKPEELPEELPAENEPLKEQPIFKKSDVIIPERKEPDNTTLETIEKDLKGQVIGLPLIMLIGVVGMFGVVLICFRQAKKRLSKPQSQIIQQIPQPIQPKPQQEYRTEEQYKPAGFGTTGTADLLRYRLNHRGIL